MMLLKSDLLMLPTAFSTVCFESSKLCFLLPCEEDLCRLFSFPWSLLGWDELSDDWPFPFDAGSLLYPSPDMTPISPFVGENVRMNPGLFLAFPLSWGSWWLTKLLLVAKHWPGVTHWKGWADTETPGCSGTLWESSLFFGPVVAFCLSFDTICDLVQLCPSLLSGPCWGRGKVWL